MGSRFNFKSVLRACCLRAALVVAVALALLASPAHAQLRVVTYNTTGAPDAGMDIVLRSIGEESHNGIAKPIDVLLLQETSRAVGLPDTQAFVDLLNTMYTGQMHNGLPITYARGFATGNVSFSEDTSQSIVYRTQTVDLVSELAIGFASGSTQPRQALRYLLRPDGYDETANFYAYNSHYKASQDSPPSTTNQDRRNSEAVAIRTNSNGLGSAHVIYAGDLNLYTAGEPAFQTLLAAGNGKAIDPLGLTDPGGTGNWSNNGAVDHAHTQSPCTSSVAGCGVGGGMDDRFDFQLITEEFDDGEGLDIIDGSYRAFGNNGVSFNQAINNSANVSAVTGYPFNGVTSHARGDILLALRNVTDHIPVVVDYQVPAIMSAIAASVPETFNLDDVFSLDLTVSNVANVVATNGADELDYSITTMLGGAALNFSSFNQMDLALGGGNLYQIPLDTSSPGEKTDLLTIASSSQGVMNQMIQIPISYVVLAAGLAGDFNDDGVVDAVDYSVWRNHLGDPDETNISNNGDGDDVSLTDYDLWKQQYGEVAPGAGSGGLAAVPEPAGAASMLVAVLVAACCLGGCRPGTLRAWTRAK